MANAIKALEAMGFAPAFRGNERIGWRGVYPPPSSSNHFRCEFCGAEHLDCTEIPHADDCAVTLARIAVGNVEARKQAMAIKEEVA